MTRRPPYKRYLEDPLVAVLLYAAYGVFKILPPDCASALGGWLGRLLGSRLARLNARAARNLRRALPHLSASEYAAIRRGMWDNLGRTLGECPHLDWIWQNRTEFVGSEHLRAMAEDGLPGAIYCGHLANWELQLRAPAAAGLDNTQVYRAPNNRLIRPLLAHIRRGTGRELVPKGSAGAKRLITVMKAHRHIGMMVDQKMNDGIAVPFFGMQAMTAPAAAQLCLRFDAPLLPLRLERLGGCRFRCTAFPPWSVADTDLPRAERVRRAMTRINADLEAWIREHPEQWLWMHRRWPEPEAVKRRKRETISK